MKNTFTKILITFVSAICLCSCTSSAIDSSSDDKSSASNITISEKKNTDSKSKDKDQKTKENNEANVKEPVKEETQTESLVESDNDIPSVTANTTNNTGSNNEQYNSSTEGPTTTQPAQDNSAANATGNDTYNGVLQTPGCKKTTVHHDAITKETSYQEWVEDKPAWTEYVQKCNSCGAEFATDDEAANHAWEMQYKGDNSHTWSEVPKYHDAEGHYETRTKTEVIVPAYDEQVCE